MKVMVETSAHHVHVTKETLAALFGKDAKLTNKKNLSQPGHASLWVPQVKLKSNAA